MKKRNKYLCVISFVLFGCITFSACGNIQDSESPKNTEIIQEEMQIDFKEDLDKPVVDKIYDDGSVTQSKEEYIKSEVRGSTLYIKLDDSFNWDKGEYDRNVLAILDELENNEINIKGLKAGHSCIILTGTNENSDIECIFNIIINDNLEISFSHETIITEKESIEDEGIEN